MIRRIVPVLLFSLFGCASPAGRDASAAQKLDTLARDYWEFQMKEAPTWATYLGDFRYNDRLADIGPEGRRRAHDAHESFLKRLRGIDPKSLGDEEQVTWDILRLRIELALEEERYKFWQWNVDQLEGPQTDFPQLINYHPLKDEKNVQDLIARFRSFPVYIDQYLENLRAGLREGRVAVRLAVERVIGQLRTMSETPPVKSPFAQALDKMSAELRFKYSEPILEAIEKQICPAFARMRAFLKEEYLPKARTEKIGLSALPDGSAAYTYRIRLHTTTDLTAEQIHRIGLGELETLQKEMLAIAKKRGHEGDLKSFIAKLTSDASNFYKTREEVLEDARRILARSEAKLPEYFERLPKVKCIVKPIEEYREKDCVGAFYYGPPEDGSRPGIYYSNTYNPTSRARYNMTALTVHEAVPGHHLQIATAIEIPDLPAFRRHGGFTAYVEGWGLYSERLAIEMGMYEDDLSRFGMLTYQAWRACRLVVDTGMHSLGWTRARAIGFFKENLALSDTEIENEIDRYIIWPGQALAYMIGRREIESLRARAQAALGGRFDLRGFHDEVLRHGSVPLSTLDKIIDAWVARR